MGLDLLSHLKQPETWTKVFRQWIIGSIKPWSHRWELNEESSTISSDYCLETGFQGIAQKTEQSLANSDWRDIDSSSGRLTQLAFVGKNTGKRNYIKRKQCRSGEGPSRFGKALICMCTCIWEKHSRLWPSPISNHGGDNKSTHLSKLTELYTE